MEKLHVTHITKVLRDIEDVVLELDAAIDSNEISPVAFENLQGRYTQALDVLADDMNHSKDSRYYIIDEAAGLFAWIKSEKEIAMSKISDAILKKGDKLLASQAGRGLALSLNVAGKSGARVHVESPHSGWLGFFYVTITLVMAPAMLVAVGGTISAAFSPSVNFTASALLVLALFYAYAILSTFYIITAPRRLRRSVPAAIVLFALLSAGCAYLLIGPKLSGSEMPGIYYISIAFLIACGVSTVIYYSVSKKVRRVFTK